MRYVLIKSYEFTSQHISLSNIPHTHIPPVTCYEKRFHHQKHEWFVFTKQIATHVPLDLSDNGPLRAIIIYARLYHIL